MLFLLAVAPAFFILWYIYHKDKYEPEPKGLIVATFFIGAALAVPAGFLEMVLEASSGIPMEGNLLGAFIGSFFIVAPIEEGAKFLSVRIKAYRSPAFNEVMDGIVYCVAGALGFATIENVFYVYQFGLATGVFRAVFAVPLHALCGAVIGYYVGMLKMDRQTHKHFLAAGLLIAILFHGAYDFVLFTETPLALLIIPIMIWLYRIYKGRLLLALEDSSSRGARDEGLYAAVARYRTPMGLVKITIGIILVAFSAVMIVGAVGSALHKEAWGVGQVLLLMIISGLPLGFGVLLIMHARKDVVVR
jgi:RsiW-degrading membrane proteinase PrsW (M82 family)